MKTRWIVALVIALLALLAIRPRQRTAADAPSVSAISAPAPTSEVIAQNPVPPLEQTVPATLPAPAPPVASLPSATAAAPRAGGSLAELRDEIETIQFALRDYRSAVGENPIGNNAEITKALLGDNPKQVKIPLSPRTSVNANGEMCDRSGRPYFFHQLFGKQMEIHSAGPDRGMGNSDDLVLK